ncbi:hypothetical protein QCA50_015880 [Cerrena zonata]|uniref:Mevalonate kinase n=1 Tax=Cerrena zonata TaxID=2478898 RepID=A0AAW0FIZ7_9APHY
MSTKPFFVSSPGKVILFGEHSAVYSKPAIAAALDLRAYLLVKPSEDPNIIRLDFPDIGLSHSWNKNDIPWTKIKEYVQAKEGKPQISEELIPEIIDLLSDNLNVPGMLYSVRSTLPIGAGLGSSAAIAVCLASAMSILGGHVAKASVDYDAKSTSKNHEDEEFIDKWSLMGEKCFHGNPSGIDNAVATHGGAVMFQRMKNPAAPSVRTNMRNFPPISLLLTNTKIPRSTAALVAGVSALNTKYSKTSASILDAMEHLANEAYQVMVKPFFGPEETRTLRELTEINHGLLVALGVSHPSLEKIKIIGDSHRIGATKLTGAGGGGCAITLLNENVSKAELDNSLEEFEANGFETYRTSLGGKGVGALYYENVQEDKREEVFSEIAFTKFKDREEIIQALGVQNVSGWKFW